MPLALDGRMFKWLFFGALVLATVLSLGLDAAAMPQASQAIDFVAERAILPALETQWSRPPATSGAGSAPPPTSP